jgi:hypothetical protein
MKKWNAELAPQAMNPGNGQSGEPIISGNNNAAVELPSEWNGTSLPESWAGDNNQRENQPLATSVAYDKAIAACEAEHEAQKRKFSKYSLCSFDIEARTIAVVFVVLVVVGITLWVAINVAEALPAR